MLRTKHAVSFESLRKLGNVLHLLRDEIRLKLMFHLMEEERNVGWLCKELGLQQPAVSHHLGLLRRAGLVQARREGKIIHYSITKKPAIQDHKFALETEEWTICFKPTRK